MLKANKIPTTNRNYCWGMWSKQWGQGYLHHTYIKLLQYSGTGYPLGTQTKYSFTHGDSGIREMGEEFGASDTQFIGLQEGSSTYPGSLTTVKIICVNS